MAYFDAYLFQDMEFDKILTHRHHDSLKYIDNKSNSYVKK